MSTKSEKAMPVKMQPLEDLKNQEIDMNVVSSVGEGPSSTESSNSLGSISPGPSEKKLDFLFDYQVYIPMGGGEPVVLAGARPPVFCTKCGQMHHHQKYCPQPCTICYSPDHSTAYCTSLSYIPEGADYDRDRYYIACGCGYPFNEKTWTCASCSGTRPRLWYKNCGICDESGHHLSHECPKDKEEAAIQKAVRDHHLLYGWHTKMPAGI